MLDQSYLGLTTLLGPRALGLPIILVPDPGTIWYLYVVARFKTFKNIFYIFNTFYILEK